MAPTVARATAAEHMLEGEVLDGDRIAAAARAATEAVNPIDDIRASAAYRSHCVRVLTARLVREAWETLTGGGMQA